jgi:hypothetical protein
MTTDDGFAAKRRVSALAARLAGPEIVTLAFTRR